MTSSCRTIPKLCAILLSLLVSPITAPGSTYDLSDFFGVRRSAQRSVAVQSTTGPDGTLPGSGGTLRLHAATTFGVITPLLAGLTHGSGVFPVPLRV